MAKKPSIHDWVWDEGDPEEIWYLEEEIAAGAFGTVYKAIHNETGQVSALKITKPEEGGESQLPDVVELHILKNCKHKNIVGLLGTWVKGQETFIALDYCGGGAVSDFYQVWEMKMTEDQIAIVARGCLEGLHYMHENNFIHRDIKGANILLDDSGEVKLVDFGVSAILQDSAQKRNTLIGTPYWMAPEVIQNKTRLNPYDEAVDIWSLGITLIELAEKDPPLSQMNPMRALMQVPIRKAPTLQNPSEWSEKFQNFLALCLEKDASKRAKIETLLKHPFVNNLKNKSILVGLINKVKEEKARLIAEENGVPYVPSLQTETSVDSDAGSNIPEPVPVAETAVQEEKQKVQPLNLNVSDGTDQKQRERSDAKSKTKSEKSEKSRDRSKSKDNGSETPKSSTSTKTEEQFVDKKPEALASIFDHSQPPTSKPNSARKNNTGFVISEQEIPDVVVNSPKKTNSGAVSTKPTQPNGPGINRAIANNPQGMGSVRGPRPNQVHATKNQQQLVAAKEGNIKLMRAQMEALRAAQKKMTQEEERAKNRNKEKERELAKKNQTAVTKQLSTAESNLQRVKKQHEAEINSEEKRSSDVIAKIGSSEDHTKRVAKEVREYHSTILSEFKKETRLLQKDEVIILKHEEKKAKDQRAKLGKKEKDAAKKAAKNEADLHTKLFQQRQDQRASRFNCECRRHFIEDIDAVKWKFHHLVQQELDRDFQEIINLKKRHAEKEYQLTVTAAEELFALHTENIQNLHPLELTNLKSIHELEQNHLGKQQFVESRQQQELLTSDYRSQLRDFNTKKGVDEKRLIAAVKEYKRDNKKKLSKAQQDSYGAQQKTLWDQEWAQKLAAFEKEQKEQREEEVSLLKAHHASQTERLKLACEEQVQNSIIEYENEKIDILTKHKESIDKLEHFYWTTLLEFTKISNKTKRDQLVTNHSAEIDLVKSVQADHQKMHEGFKDELKALAVTQELSTLQQDDFSNILDAHAQDLLLIEQQKLACLAVVHEEELDEIDELNTKEEKQVLGKAPPGVFSS